MCIIKPEPQNFHHFISQLFYHAKFQKFASLKYIFLNKYCKVYSKFISSVPESSSSSKMKLLKVSIIICLIYQALAGGPGLSSLSTPPTSSASQLPACIRCTNVFQDGIAPTHNDCDAGSSQKVILTVYFTNALGTISGACADPVLSISNAGIDSNISDYATDIPLLFAS